MAAKAQKIPFSEVSAPSTPASGEVVVYAKADGLMYSKDDAGVETAMSDGSAAHIADTTDAHEASAVSFDATGLDNTSATEVQTALEDFDAAITAAGGGGGAPRSCRVHNSGAQSIANSSEVTMTFDTEDADASGIHSAGTFTPPAGDWRVTVNYMWAASTGGNYRQVLVKRGSAYVANDTRPPTASTGYAGGSISIEMYGMTGSEAVLVRAAQNSGGALNMGDGTFLTRVEITEIV